MKRNFVLLSVLIALMFNAGCSGVKKNRDSDLVKNNEATSALAANEDASSEYEQISYDADSSAGRRSETRIGAYNSEISVSFDGSGNKIENRSFNNHSRLSFIIVTTHVKGQQEVIVVGKNGQSRKMSPDEFNGILTASPDEIADRAGILEPVKPVAPLPQTATKIETVQSENSLIPSPPSQSLPEETTVVETEKIQTALEPQPSPVQQAKKSSEEPENKANLKQF
ncbi:MAG: hypothetical protein M3209_20295 [Acidobacteriota bacterium]|nr:hypothetical protein [Acidobacteriota bacterium]